MSDSVPDPEPDIDGVGVSDAEARLGAAPPRSGAGWGGWTMTLLIVLWAASVGGAWYWGGQRGSSIATATAPRPAADSRLQQRISTLQMSDQISRQANRELQQTLAEREEEVAGLRADVAFYERLVGSTGQRKGLSVHDVELRRDSDGSWRYTVMLTQNLNRGAVSKGALTLSVEGTRNGKLTRLGWNDLLQRPQALPQRFEFRYFQRLEGSLLLPQGFVPGRVIAQVRADRAGTVEQSFAWADAAQ